MRISLLRQVFFLLHCSLWEHKSLAEMIVKRDISGSSSLSHLLLSIYHDHCGSHQWKSLCTLERSLTLFLALCFWTYSNLHWLPLHLGHGCHPGIPLHCPLTAFFTFSFIRSLILLALSPFDETYPSRLSLGENVLSKYVEMLHAWKYLYSALVG